jgi:hypothetical protein
VLAATAGDVAVVRYCACGADSLIPNASDGVRVVQARYGRVTSLKAVRPIITDAMKVLLLVALLKT